MSLLRSQNNKTRDGLGRVCATGMYRSNEHVKFPKFQTGIFGEWKAPLQKEMNEEFEVITVTVSLAATANVFMFGICIYGRS